MHQDLTKELQRRASELTAKQVRLENTKNRIQRLEEDLRVYQKALQEGQQDIRLSRTALETALDKMTNNTALKDVLLEERESLRATLQERGQHAKRARDALHANALARQTLRTEVQAMTTGLQRLTQQQTGFVTRRSAAQKELEQMGAAAEDAHQLDALLEQQAVLTDQLSTARSAVEAIEQEMRAKEKKRSLLEQESEVLRTQLEAFKMEWQALEVRSQTIEEKLVELGVSAQKVLETLPPDATEVAWAKALETVSLRIQRLGAINLAAIEEYQIEAERKTYLDVQHKDLSEALETLESAIRKIDKETRQRFKETFDKVNAEFKVLFPKLFGGGEAYLELVGDDLLEAGLTVMARPPGKRNSTIHLLSGGEKALTAVSLVFAIFQLNPAPFCMLDEVDAPLDDANVGRFCKLVQHMSKNIQFIIITHNKLAMEIAHHLIGVTMKEPGVSRLVSVDIEQAVALIED